MSKTKFTMRYDMNFFFNHTSNQKHERPLSKTLSWHLLDK